MVISLSCPKNKKPIKPVCALFHSQTIMGTVFFSLLKEKIAIIRPDRTCITTNSLPAKTKMLN